MNTDLSRFVTKYLTIVMTTLMSVSFVAFVSIPYSLGGHPGDVPDAPVSASLASTQQQA